MSKVKLSELPNDALLSYEDAHFTVSPGELRQRIEDGEDLVEHTWYVASEQRWKPDAKQMLREYIEIQYEEMYEDWDDRAYDCLKQEHYDRIQAVLDKAFSSDHATKYWMLDGPEVIID
ncbi:hypothetical protein GRF59_14395 [Paenibacillus sp. HJL G12]|uniref:Uncharacterized protein n=1 Tax=Paenibacillus dendrobii TaxID=2691084 RepID=A0A7X3IMJ1_9BACL|nr:hypothetical protein [Paenibacillus dendrobii]MWV44807.1 hypothetical protein [Paenibacillus dendrobii]